MSYRVKLENFEGPLDLLMFFIHRDRLNIYDIPIAHITREFLDMLEMIKLLNIQVAGEFIVMAATLIQIKARMLLPRKENEEGEIIDDPRTELVQRLLDYKRFKEAAHNIQNLQQEHSMLYPRTAVFPLADIPEDPSVFVGHVTLFDLLRLFKEALDRAESPAMYELTHEPVQLDDQIDFLFQQLAGKESLSFYSLIEMLDTKLKIIVTFMALLELIRERRISIIQNDPFGEIAISTRS